MTDSIPAFAADIQAALVTAKGLPLSELHLDLQHMHRVVANSHRYCQRSSIQEWNRNNRKLNDRAIIPIEVSDDQLFRSLSYLDAVLRSVEAVGGAVDVKERSEACLVGITICGEYAAAPKLREKRKMVPNPKAKDPWESRTAYAPSGILILEDANQYAAKPLAKDSPKLPIEQTGNALVLKLVLAAQTQRQFRRAAEELRQVEAEMERTRRDERERHTQILQGFQESQRLEQSRLDDLRRQIASWRDVYKRQRNSSGYFSSTFLGRYTAVNSRTPSRIGT